MRYRIAIAAGILFLVLIATGCAGGNHMPVEQVLTSETTKPRLVHFEPAVYPELAKLSLLEGEVLVNVLVGMDGRVLDTEILRAAHPMLARAAAIAARKCLFEPRDPDDGSGDVWSPVTYRFELP